MGWTCDKNEKGISTLPHVHSWMFILIYIYIVIIQVRSVTDL